MVLIAVVLLAIQALLIRPWGDFPLNDDWGHTLLTWRWWQTGEFKAFIPITPSLVGQAWWGKLFLPYFSSPHVALRVANVVAMAGLALVVDLCARHLRFSVAVRAMLLIVLVTNPLMTSLTFSNLTDVFALWVSYTGVWVWLKHIDPSETRVTSPRRSNFSSLLALTGAALMGAVFWTRQLAVLVYPATLLALGRGLQRRLYLVASVVFALAAGSYVLWAKVSANLNSDFTRKLSIPLGKNLLALPSVLPVWVFYVLGLVLPLVAFVAEPRRLRRTITQKKFQWLMGFLLLSSAILALTANRTYNLQASVHAHFPFLGNVVNPYGLGPITLSDVYSSDTTILPNFYAAIWVVLQLVFALSAAAWWGTTARVSAGARYPLRFAAAVVSITFLATGICFGQGTFDRYLFAVFPALLLGAGTVVQTTGLYRSGRRWALFLLVTSLYSYFGVAGVHDYFRWNEARQELAAEASLRGIGGEKLDAGYEVNAWDYYTQTERPDLPCVRHFFFCRERRYAIALNPTNRVLSSRAVSSWLGRFPDVLLVDREGP